ncbi:hypothetical protein [Mycolicibacterium mengxianglii]|uniref:hypothetical protein n=1 Tax=Mycolicibacterium mengxianglii TaxID=2736649 RepID=UPI0018EF107C|nr:hypothetical protein [Mycolicibacterium mengxianglii]
MTVTTEPTLEPTDAEIDAAILRAIDQTGEELVPWATIRQQVPGTFWRKAGAFGRLWCDGRIFAIKIGGRNYVARGDEADALRAARDKAAGRVRGVRCL